MLTRWIDDLKKTPSRFAERREQLSERRKELAHKARTQLQTAAGDSQERMFHWRAGTLERFDAAAEAYHKAIGIEPTFPDPYYNLARLLERKGNQVAALRHLKTYRKLTEEP